MKGKRLIQMMCDVSDNFINVRCEKRLQHHLYQLIKCKNKIPHNREGYFTVQKVVHNFMEKYKSL